MDELIRGSPQMKKKKHFHKFSNTNISIEDLNTFLCAQKPHIPFFQYSRPIVQFYKRPNEPKETDFHLSAHTCIHEKHIELNVKIVQQPSSLLRRETFNFNSN